MGTAGQSETVLVVEDEEDLALLYSTWLEPTYEVRTATSGEEAFEKLDGDVDVALLDRRMPGLTGDEVLGGIRERGVDCRVAMITAVEPDLDVVDMAFDDYLVKPVTQSDLSSIVEVLLRRAAYDDRTQEFFQLASKKAALEASDSEGVRETPEFESLTDRMEELRSDINRTLTELSSDDFEEAFRSLPEVDSDFGESEMKTDGGQGE